MSSVVVSALFCLSFVQQSSDILLHTETNPLLSFRHSKEDPSFSETHFLCDNGVQSLEPSLNGFHCGHPCSTFRPRRLPCAAPVS